MAGCFLVAVVLCFYIGWLALVAWLLVGGTARFATSRDRSAAGGGVGRSCVFWPRWGRGRHGWEYSGGKSGLCLDRFFFRGLIMGSIVEFNDTLKLIRGDGFPHVIEEGGEYEFLRKGIRIFHPSPVRVFLVEEIDGKWNFVGKVAVIKQTIDAEKYITYGTFRVLSIYPDEVRRIMNNHEAPEGKSYA